jgi:peroxiredoxin
MVDIIQIINRIVMRSKQCFLVLACLMLSGMMAAQEVGNKMAESRSGTGDSVRQKKELDAWLAPVVYRLDTLSKGWVSREQHQFDSVTRKFDTTGLAAVRLENLTLNKQKKDKLIEFVRSHPAYYIDLIALRQTLIPVPDDISITDRLFNSLDDKVKETPSGLELKRTIANFMKVATGKPAPLFTAPDTSGHAVSLASFRGKYVLLDFWASWCGPCREENPNVVEAYKEFHPKNFEIISVSLDQPGKRENWVNAIRQDGLHWQHVSDLKFWDSEVAKLYSIRSIPQNFLIDPQGKIIAANLRGKALWTTLQTVL